jgi:hypothetical protein
VSEARECSVLELHPLDAPSAKILRLVEALHDAEALGLFLENVFCLSETALALGMPEKAVLGLVERGGLRALRVGGNRRWLFPVRRITDLVLAADQERDRQGLRAAERFFKDLGYREGLAVMHGHKMRWALPAKQSPSITFPPVKPHAVAPERDCVHIPSIEHNHAKPETSAI